MNKAIFLDRDGVINDGSLYYTYRIEDFRLNKGVIEGLRILQQNEYKLIVITNQGGVAKKQYTMDDVEKVHNYLQDILAQSGITLTDIYTCPHHSDIAPCSCRKPLPGMILDAIEKYNIDPNQSYMIGDSPRDIEASTAGGVTGIKIDKNENILPYCEQIVNRHSVC